MAGSTGLRLNHAPARGVKSLGSGYPVRVNRARRMAGIAPRRAVGRTTVALAVGAASALALGLRYSTAVSSLGRLNAGGLTLLALAWRTICTADPQTTAQDAAAEDPCRS